MTKVSTVSNREFVQMRCNDERQDAPDQRELPDSLHRRIEAAAAMAGLSLRDYLVAVFEGRLPPPSDEKGAK